MIGYSLRSYTPITHDNDLFLTCVVRDNVNSAGNTNYAAFVIQLISINNLPIAGLVGMLDIHTFQRAHSI